MQHKNIDPRIRYPGLCSLLWYPSRSRLPLRTSFPRSACRHILSPRSVCRLPRIVFSSCNLVPMFCYQHSRATVLLHALLLLPHLRILYSCVAHSTLLSLASHRRTSPRALCWYSRVLSSSLNLLYLLEYSLLVVVLIAPCAAALRHQTCIKDHFRLSIGKAT